MHIVDMPHSLTSPASFPDLPCLIPRPPLPHSQAFPASFPDLPCLIPRLPCLIPRPPYLIPRPPLPHSQTSPASFPDLPASFPGGSRRVTLTVYHCGCNGKAKMGGLGTRLNNMLTDSLALCSERESELLSSLHAYRQGSRGG